MPRLFLTALLLLAPLSAVANDLKISVLEQDVRDLKRQVQALSRQIDDLATRPPRPAGGRTPTPSPAASNTTNPWVDASKWNRLRPGMSELEVISSLGSPTSMREESGARVLRYAMEIGSTGFLAGSVTLRDRVVVEVRKPELQ